MRLCCWCGHWLIAFLTLSAIASGQVITTVAGGGWRPFPSPVAALKAPLGIPGDPAFDGQGNLYLPDSYNNIVVKLSTDGTLTVVAGNGNAGFSGDGGPATGASLNAPTGVAVDSAGNLYIADSQNNRVRKVSGGVITTVGGIGTFGFAGDGGPATKAQLYLPISVALDRAGNVYVADSGNQRIRLISGGTIKTIAGNGIRAFSGDGGPATSASLNLPRGIALDAMDNLYIGDYNNRVRKVSGGTISTVAGNGLAGFSGDGSSAVAASLSAPQAVTVDAGGQLFIADTNNNRVRKVADGIITTVAGNGAGRFSGDAGSATGASLNRPLGVSIDAAGQIFIADSYNERIRKISSNTITTVLGSGSGTFFGDAGPGTSAGLFLPAALAIDADGNQYIADSNNNCVRRVSGGTISTVAGNGVAGFSGDGGPAAVASLNNPLGVAVDAAGNLYIADSNNDRIRKVSGGIITTVAGPGTFGNSGDGGPATAASLSFPNGIATDTSGDLYIAEAGNNRIRMVSGGTITTVAGTGVASFSGDGGPATSAALNFPTGVAFDAAGNLYIADYSNNRVREVSNGTITTVAGNGMAGESGDGGPAVAAASYNPGFVAVDPSGNIFIAEVGGNRIRKVSGGTISTFAGGAYGYSGDGGAAKAALLAHPSALVVDSGGNLYVADTYNNRIREVLINPPSYQVSPVALTFSASSGGSIPGAQTISLSASVPGLGFTTSTSATWLTVTPSNGSMPASLQMTADPTNLAPGNYQGKLTISVPNATTPTTTVAVTFTVGAKVPAQLSVGPQTLTFTAIQGGVPQSAQAQVANAGGGSLSFTAVASTANGGNWLLVSQSSGTATPSSAASLTVTADPSSLLAGTYHGTVAITGAGTTTNLAVTLSVSIPSASLLLSQSGLSFVTVAQGGSPLPQAFGILNTGQGAMNWTAIANTLSAGSNWLKISPSSGTVVQPYLDVSMVNVSIDPTGLAAGAYYGRIQISALAVNSPQVLTVILTVLPAGTTPGPEVRPAGLIFTGSADVSPDSQDVMIGNPKAVSDNYLSASIGNAFSYLPTSSDVPPNQPTTLRVFPDFSGVQPGQITRGTIALQFSDGTPRTVSTLTVVAPPATAAGKIGALDSGGCTKPILEIQLRSPMQSFSAVLGQPVTVEAQVVDDCGNLIGPNSQNAAVSATFSNKDSDIKLTHIGNGVWTGTWRPVKPMTGPVSIGVTAFNSNGSVVQSGQQAESGSLNAGVTPTVTAGGVVHAASDAAGVPVAPGSLITIYGSNLADATGLASTLPLPQLQNGTQVRMGNQLLPILYTSDGQINVQVPFNTPVNTQYQLSVQRDNLLSVPEQLVVAVAQPGVFAVNQQGNGQGVIFKSDGVTLAQPGSAATVGETVVIYCTGLGVVSPAVPEGTPPPSSPLSNTVNTVTVSIGGQDAPVQFSGLTPGFPGLYQVNAVVPSGVPGDAVPLVVSVAGQTSPAVTLAIQ
jgi:uncharacterized protein (TIGR03437 family)